MCAKIAKVRIGKKQPTQDGAFGAGHQPTQADTGSRRRASAKPAGSDEEYITVLNGVRLLDPLRSCSVTGSGKRDRKSAFISVGAAYAVFEGVVEGSEELKPPLDSRVMVPYFADALKRFVVRKYA